MNNEIWPVYSIFSIGCPSAENRKMDSLKAFKIMERFISGIAHIPTHNKFIDVISRKKPFANFNHLISYYPDLRQEWFAYKNQSNIEFVKDSPAGETQIDRVKASIST